MSCYGTINGDATHHYVNGDFLAEKLRIEETELEVFFCVCEGYFLVLPAFLLMFDLAFMDFFSI